MPPGQPGGIRRGCADDSVYLTAAAKRAGPSVTSRRLPVAPRTTPRRCPRRRLLRLLIKPVIVDSKVLASRSQLCLAEGVIEHGRLEMTPPVPCREQQRLLASPSLTVKVRSDCWHHVRRDRHGSPASGGLRRANDRASLDPGDGAIDAHRRSREINVFAAQFEYLADTQGAPRAQESDRLPVLGEGGHDGVQLGHGRGPDLTCTRRTGGGSDSARVGGASPRRPRRCSVRPRAACTPGRSPSGSTGPDPPTTRAPGSG